MVFSGLTQIVLLLTLHKQILSPVFTCQDFIYSLIAVWEIQRILCQWIQSVTQMEVVNAVICWAVYSKISMVSIYLYIYMMVAIHICKVLTFLPIRLLFMCIYKKKKKFRSATGNEFFLLWQQEWYSVGIVAQDRLDTIDFVLFYLEIKPTLQKRIWSKLS